MFYSLNRIASNVVCSNKLLEIGVWDVIRLNAFLCQVLVVMNCMNTFTVISVFCLNMYKLKKVISEPTKVEC